MSSPATATTVSQPEWVGPSQPEPAPKNKGIYKILALVLLAAILAIDALILQSTNLGDDLDTFFGYTIPWIVPIVLIILGAALITRGWFGKTFVLGGILVLAWNAHAFLYPPELAGVRVVTHDANKMVQDHARGIKGEMEDHQEHIGTDKNHRVNLDVWWNSRKPLVNEVAKAQTLRDAALARAERRVPILRENIVSGLQKNWREKFSASEPLLVTFSPNEVMCSAVNPSICWHADGIFHDGKPASVASNLTVMENPDWGGTIGGPSGSYGAVLVRTCTGGACSEPAEAGFAFAACPANNSTTSVMMVINRFTTVGNFPSSEDFNSKEAFSFEVHTWDDPEAGTMGILAKQACDAHPSNGFVRLPKSAATN